MGRADFLIKESTHFKKIQSTLMFGSFRKMQDLMEIEHQMSVGIIYGLILSSWQHWQHKTKGQHASASFSGNTRLIPAKPIIIHFAREISADVIFSRCDKSAVVHPEKSAADRNAIPRQVP